jgi:hypothetical protein
MAHNILYSQKLSWPTHLHWRSTSTYEQARNTVNGPNFFATTTF